MGILFRKLLRDIKEAKGQFISILIIVVLGVTLFSGINATFRNLTGAKTKYYEDYRFADLWVELYKAPKSVTERINSLPYVEMVTGRIVADAGINFEEENASIRFITLPDVKNDIVNDIVIKSGRYFSDEESSQCLVEEEFFIAHNLDLGDYIYPIVNGNEIKIKVIGTAKSPEYVYTLKDGSELITDSKKFGIVYIKDSFGQGLLGYNGAINSASILLKDGIDTETAAEDIKKDLRNYGVTSVIENQDQLSNKMLSEEIRGLESMGSSFPIVFFLVAATIIYIMMSRMVENQRTQIGILKALGFTNLQVLVHYLTYSVLLAVTGSIIGSVLGMYLGYGMTNLENMYFHLPLEEMRIYPELVFPASSLTLVFCLLAGYNSCKSVFKIMPSEAMMPKAPKIGKKIFLEKVQVLWANINNTWRIILRNIFRHKRRALLTSTGIIFSTALLFFAFSMKDSMDFMIVQQYENIQNYDIKVNFSGLVTLEDLYSIKNLAHVTMVEPVLETGVELQNGWRKKSAAFTALINEPEMYRVIDKKGLSVELPQNGIVLPDRLAKTLGVNINDTIYLKSYLPGKEKREVTVKGISTQYLGLSAYASLDNVHHILGEGTVVNSTVIKLDSIIYENEIKDKLRDMSKVTSVQSKTDALDSLMKNMGAMTSSMGVFIFLAAILSIAVVYNTATINIFERQRELATLKVLGFKDNEIKSLIFNENYMITIFGIIIGLPFGYWLGDYLMSSFTSDVYSFPFEAKPFTYFLAAFLTLVFTVMANSILTKKIRNLSIVEVLKNRE
ncbi:cell division ABC transporter subunit FtsX [Oxobacter pfennigii]|uniref:Cell division ABC transporter subunit FtsX n=1 Tax=Oxobacter pfennigii TaxID=36849 RepID=A0A0P9AJB1_9CLOT|nr:FtsX-like permease family protein [Oxobacter pfennigii]KPU45509.1 cell division ABC transporter subunit FtsX [Oxobacter pfennigii]